MSDEQERPDDAVEAPETAPDETAASEAGAGEPPAPAADDTAPPAAEDAAGDDEGAAQAADAADAVEADLTAPGDEGAARVEPDAPSTVDADVTAAADEAVEPSFAPESAPEPEPESAPRLHPAELKAIVEALVFAAPEPVTIKGLHKVLSEEPVEAIEAAVAALIQDYEGRGLQVAQVAGGYQITTRQELHEWVRRLFHERTTQKLSVQALETLAVIAYRQPVTAAEITEIRGVNASGVLSTLLERHLVKIVGRRNVVGRPFLYGTTKEFLIRFGLKDVTDLPKMEDMVAALGFEPPALLVEKPVADEMLPLEEDELDIEDRPAPPAPAEPQE